MDKSVYWTLFVVGVLLELSPELFVAGQVGISTVTLSSSYPGRVAAHTRVVSNMIKI